MGGLARKATIIENLINSGDNPLVLDAGDLFFKSTDIDPGIALDVAKINAKIINDSFNLMGCDGFSPGSSGCPSRVRDAGASRRRGTTVTIETSGGAFRTDAPRDHCAVAQILPRNSEAGTCFFSLPFPARSVGHLCGHRPADEDSRLLVLV